MQIIFLHPLQIRQFHCSPHEVNIERCLPPKAWKFAVTSILAAPSELTVSAALVRDGVPSAARQSRLSGSWREEAQSPFVSVVFLSLLQRAAIFGMCVSRGTWTFWLPIRQLLAYVVSSYFVVSRVAIVGWQAGLVSDLAHCIAKSLVSPDTFRQSPYLIGYERRLTSGGMALCGSVQRSLNGQTCQQVLAIVVQR